MSKRSVIARRDGSNQEVSLQFQLSVRGWGGSGSIKQTATTYLSLSDARGLAAEITAAADEAEARNAAKQATQARRKKWRDREIAAGRMIVL